MLTIDEAGNVGIGTTNPLAALAVGATSQFQVNSSGAIAAATGITSSGTITFSGLAGDGAETTGVLINGNNLVTREFGDLAFSSATYDNYQYWTLEANSAAGSNITTTGTVSFDGGGIVATARSGDALHHRRHRSRRLDECYPEGIPPLPTRLAFNCSSGSPFTVTNETVVTHLNADLLDRNHANAFQTALTNPVTGTGTTGSTLTPAGPPAPPSETR